MKRTRWRGGLITLALIAGCSSAGHSGGRSPSPATGSHITIPSGFKAVSYHGIEFAVPSRLFVAHGNSCGPLPANSVLTEDPGMVTGCIAGGNPTPRAGAIYIWAVTAGSDHAAPADRLATRSTTVAQYPARISYGKLPGYPGITGVLALSDPAVQLTVTAPSRATVTTILGSVQLAAVDDVGCPAREPAMRDNASASSLAPVGASAITLCGYSGFSSDHRSDFWLTGSAAVPSSQVATTVAQLNALPSGSPPGANPLHDYVLLSYPDGQSRWLSVSIASSSPALAVSDGSHTDTIGEHIGPWKLLYPNSAWPESVVS